jgi:hypothetical protein
MSSPYEDGNEQSDSIKGQEFAEQLRKYEEFCSTMHIRLQ